jgi:uncharacterized membrane protein YhhN
MKKNNISVFAAAYLLFLAINILSQMLAMPAWVLPVSKTLLMPVLMLGLVTAIQRPLPALAYIILSALFFSWAGDVLLLFQENSPGYFISGLVSFLCAHLAYISFFVKIKKPAPGWWIKNKIVIFIVLAYGFFFLAILWKHLGAMQIPVLIYTICIVTMLISCMRTQPDVPKVIWIWMGIGAWLFVMSDCILALNKFMQPFQLAGPFIMLTYGLAQLFIVIGSIRFFRATFGATAIPAE